VGLGAPILEGFLGHRHIKPLLGKALVPAVVLGVGAAALVMLGDALLFVVRLPPNIRKLQSDVAIWKGLLACVYGGITEELYARLFVFSSLAWLFWRVGQYRIPPTNCELWLVNFIAAAIFAAGHLPLTRAVIGLSPLIVTRALVLNGLPGLVFGWLYWHHGLEASMIAHFSTDFVIQSTRLFQRRS
jgi:hypothetical protein